jgi:DNA sulfur modification protein DndE
MKRKGAKTQRCNDAARTVPARSACAGIRWLGFFNATLESDALRPGIGRAPFRLVRVFAPLRLCVKSCRGSAALLLAMSLSAVAAFAQTNPITLHMIGDSTMANKPVIPANPERGWGQMFHMYFNDSIRVENYAQNGRSTKSFIAEGRWDKVVAALKPGDFVIIQFGHNDEKTNNVKVGTAPFGEFTENLTRFVRESRQHQATPILATPVARRKFDETGTLTNSHGVYPEAVRKAAAKENVPLFELCTATEKLLQQLGPESSKRLFDWIPPGEFAARPAGLEDDTHFNAYGASRVCDLAVIELEAKVPALAERLIQRNKETKPTQPQSER